MIYLDNAATSFPKPACVHRQMITAGRCFAANPGRGGYPMAMAATEALYACRETAARVFGLPDPRRVVFTLNCTAALNIVIKSIFRYGGRAVVSDREHNAVMRPLHALAEKGVRYDAVPVVTGDAEGTVEAFRRAITPQTKAIICTQVSNVTGEILPVKRLAKLAHERGLVMVVDAAQSAGHVPIHMEQDGIDYLCVAGHKGLFGPMGTGMLLCRGESPLVPLVEGGTGSASLSLAQPEAWPDRLESGTPNVVGICGLHAGLRFVEEQTIQRIASRETALCRMLYDAASGVSGIHLYSSRPAEGHTAAVVSLTVDNVSTERAASALAAHGIAVRGGLHCAPAAHHSLGTVPDGTVRLSPGLFNTEEQMQKTAQILKKIAANPLSFAV